MSNIITEIDNDLIWIVFLIFLTIQLKDFSHKITSSLANKPPPADKKSWKEQSVALYLGPLFIQIERLENAFSLALKEDHIAIDLSIKSLHEIQKIITQNLHLVPGHLIIDAHHLLSYCDIWIARLNKALAMEEPDAGYISQIIKSAQKKFPTTSSERFKSKFNEYWEDLYSIKNIN